AMDFLGLRTYAPAPATSLATPPGDVQGQAQNANPNKAADNPGGDGGENSPADTIKGPEPHADNGARSTEGAATLPKPRDPATHSYVMGGSGVSTATPRYAADEAKPAVTSGAKTGNGTENPTNSNLSPKRSDQPAILVRAPERGSSPVLLSLPDQTIA